MLATPRHTDFPIHRCPHRRDTSAHHKPFPSLPTNLRHPAPLAPHRLAFSSLSLATTSATPARHKPSQPQPRRLAHPRRTLSILGDQPPLSGPSRADKPDLVNAGQLRSTNLRHSDPPSPTSQFPPTPTNPSLSPTNQLLPCPIRTDRQAKSSPSEPTDHSTATQSTSHRRIKPVRPFAQRQARSASTQPVSARPSSPVRPFARRQARSVSTSPYPFELPALISPYPHD